MRTFAEFLERRGFHADACESLVDEDFYQMAACMWEALEIIADPSTTCMTHAGTVGALRAHARLGLNPAEE